MGAYGVDRIVGMFAAVSLLRNNNHDYVCFLFFHICFVFLLNSSDAFMSGYVLGT